MIQGPLSTFAGPATVVVALLTTVAIAFAQQSFKMALLLELHGRYATAARVRLSLVPTLQGPMRVDNLVLAGADEYESGAPCYAVQIWRQAVTPGTRLYSADDFAIRRIYPTAFREYAVLFGRDVSAANPVFMHDGSVSRLTAALDDAAMGRMGQAFKETDPLLRRLPLFRWALVIHGDLYDSERESVKAAKDWLTALRTEEPEPPESTQIVNSAFVALEMLYHRTAPRCGS